MTQPTERLCECGQPDNSIRHSFTAAKSVDAHAFKPTERRVAERRIKEVQMMRLPKNSAYPNYSELHVADHWCPKAGCTPICNRRTTGDRRKVDWHARYDKLLAVAEWMNREIDNYHDHDDMGEQRRCKLCAAQTKFTALEKTNG